MDKSNKKKKDQLGISFGTANNRLKKIIMFDLVKKLNLNICFQCEKLIENENEFSIEHKKPYLDSENPKELFFDLNNIAFSHLSCNVRAGKKRDHVYRKSSSIYKGVKAPSEKYRHKKWRVTIKNKTWGGFNSAIEAAIFYDNKIIELYGENALTNKKLNLL